MTIVWLSLAHYYTTFTGFLAYLAIFFKRFSLSQSDWMVLFGLLSLTLFQLIEKNPLAILIDLRFYWGWLVFYFIFKATPISRTKLAQVIAVLCFLIILEVILINTVISPHMLPNYPTLKAGAYEWVPEGIYQRPYSFGASATVGSSLMVVLLAMANLVGFWLWVGIISVLLFASGTGTIALIILAIARYPVQLLKIFIPVALLSLLAGLFFTDFVLWITPRILVKISPEYMSEVLNYKLLQIDMAYEQINSMTLIFGHPEGFRGGDFALLAFILSNGIFGIVLFTLALLSNISQENRLPLFLLIVTSIHYPVMFYLPGQMLLGLLLANQIQETHNPETVSN